MTINEDYVWAIMQKLNGFSDEDKDKCMMFCTIASNEMQRRLSDDAPPDTAVIASAFLALYYYCVLNNIEESGEMQFEAGDISVRCDSSTDKVDGLRATAFSLVDKYLLLDSDFFFGVI